MNLGSTKGTVLQSLLFIGRHGYPDALSQLIFHAGRCNTAAS